MAYDSTTVPVERSQAQIRKLLSGAGARQLAFAEDRDLTSGDRRASVSFAIENNVVRLLVPLKPVSPRAVSEKFSRSRTKTRAEIEDGLYEQEERRIWRVLAWNLKARMVAVEEGVETFEEAFLAHLLDPQTGETIYEQLARTGAVSLSAPLALGAGKEET